jgi:hypothetical protein
MVRIKWFGYIYKLIFKIKDTEGIFRIPAEKRMINEMMTKINNGETIDFDKTYQKDNENDIHAVANFISTYLRELKEPLFPSELYEVLIATMSSIFILKQRYS